MKKLITMLAVFGMVGLVLYACKDDAPTPLNIATLKAGDLDLNGATSATTVAPDAVITAVFSTDVDASTATSTNIIMTRTFDNSAVATTIAVNGNTVTITPTARLFDGDQYKVELTTGLKSSKGQALTDLNITFGTKGIGLGTAPQSAKQMLYVQFSNDIVDLTGKATKASAQVTYANDRFGNANSAASFNGGTGAGTGDIVELSGNSFIAPSMTMSVWVYIDQTNYVAPGNRPLMGLAGNNGWWAEIGDGDAGPNWLKIGTNHKVDPDPQNHVFATAWGDFGSTDGGAAVNTLTTTGWHQLVMTFDAATYTKTDYWDGAKIKTFNLLDATNNEWNLKDMVLNNLTGVDGKLALGSFASKANTNPDWAMYSNAPRTFKGLMDDLRLFNVALSASEVTTLYTAEKPQ
jgi:hypothetical protein